MTPQIIQKMQAEIQKGIKSEAQVVYLLSAIRKIIETDNLRDDYPYLNFHCNWALHTKLDRKDAQEVLKYFNQAHPHLQEGCSINDLPQKIRTPLERIFRMARLEQEMSSFLAQHQITDITKMYNPWVKFLKYYAQVIEDCPLVLKTDMHEQYNIKQVIVKTELANRIERGQVYYKISWIIEDKHGQSGELYFINSFDVEED
jgi:hypothetical protein